MRSRLYSRALDVPGLPKGFCTTCRRVAHYFQEPHAQVQRCIRTILKDMTDDKAYCRAHFGLRRHKDGKVEHLMSETGFAFLAMNLTGAKALQWQLDMVQTYSRMRQEVEHLKNSPVSGTGTRTLQ